MYFIFQKYINLMMDLSSRYLEQPSTNSKGLLEWTFNVKVKVEVYSWACCVMLTTLFCKKLKRHAAFDGVTKKINGSNINHINTQNHLKLLLPLDNLTITCRIAIESIPSPRWVLCRGWRKFSKKIQIWGGWYTGGGKICKNCR